VESNLKEVTLKTSYNSAADDLLEDFYVPCLNAAKSYDRAAGYFRSTVLHLIGVALSRFALHGGHMRLVCSPSLDNRDRDTILASESRSETEVQSIIAADLTACLENPTDRPVTELLATLVVHQCLEIKIAYRPEQIGIFHDKLGLFEDAEHNAVSFRGSANETYLSWSHEGNHEGFEAFASWEGGRDTARTHNHRHYFDKLWAGQLPNISVVPLSRVPLTILERYANPDGIEKAIENARAHIRNVRANKEAPTRVLQEHQREVVGNWKKHKRGIIDHATGSGKTIAALAIIRDWLNAPGHAAVILVPQSALSDQWVREIAKDFHSRKILLLRVGGANSDPDWRGALGAFTGHRKISTGGRITIATLQSASKPDFIDRVRGGDHLLLVADEVHWTGATSYRATLTIPTGGRLGLSATPNRYNDPEGTEAILAYFGNILQPTFTIVDAQKAGRLVPYDYFIHPVPMTDAEVDKYQKLTQRIGSLTARDDDEAKRMRNYLLIERARIVKKAQGKIAVAQQVLRETYKKGQRWLIYCDDTDQLHQASRALAQLGIQATEYSSSMESSRPDTLRAFETLGGILLSMKCLDEGVDIPTVTHALILASSINSREHIQRRGRIIRKTEDKYSAEIHDTLVTIEHDGRSTALRAELGRARAFAHAARNVAAKYLLDTLFVDETEDGDELENLDQDDRTSPPDNDRA